MLRRVRESLIKVLSEANTIYVGKGVYRWVNQHDKLVIRSDQRIVPCDSIWPDWGKEKVMLTILMERDWDEISKWYKPRGYQPDETYSSTKEAWKQWKRWIVKHRTQFFPNLELMMVEANAVPEIKDLEHIREIQKSFKK